MDPESKLKELGITLPSAPKPVAAYVPAARSGDLLFVAGQLPFVDGRLPRTGAVGKDVTLEDATKDARQCALNGLAVARAELGTLSGIVRVVRLEVFVASAPGFYDHPRVANGASELLVQVFGEAGKHARLAVGVPSLPMNAPVEVAFTFEVRLQR